MTDSKPPQQSSNADFQQPLEEETTFIDVLAILVKKKLLILLITSLGTFLSFCYYCEFNLETLLRTCLGT